MSYDNVCAAKKVMDHLAVLSMDARSGEERTGTPLRAALIRQQ